MSLVRVVMVVRMVVVWYDWFWLDAGDYVVREAASED